VIQRFGDVKKLITQTLDPMLSAYFRDVAHKKTMLQLLQERDAIQMEAKQQLHEKFADYDIECVDVLIGKPTAPENDHKIENLLEQLRQRQLSMEQVETYEKQRISAEKLKGLQEAQAIAQMQTELTNSHVMARIAENKGEADLARARKQAEQLIVTAQAENQQRIIQADADLARAKRQAEQTVLLAEADSKQKVLAGRGEGARQLQIGLSEVAVLLRKISSFGDPRLYALTQAAERLANSQQPLVPEKMFIAGGSTGDAPNAGTGLLGTLISLLVAEKSGFQPADGESLGQLKDFADKMTAEALAGMQQAALAVEVNGAPKAVEKVK
jgi:regulator of protease activity HflC (stomatin/prohibitin superfamily)